MAFGNKCNRGKPEFLSALRSLLFPGASHPCGNCDWASRSFQIFWNDLDPNFILDAQRNLTRDLLNELLPLVTTAEPCHMIGFEIGAVGGPNSTDDAGGTNKITAICSGCFGREFTCFNAQSLCKGAKFVEVDMGSPCRASVGWVQYS